LRSRRRSKRRDCWRNSAFHREAFADKGPLTIVIEGDPHLLNRYDVIEQSEKHLGASRRWAVFNFRYDD
jgi:hypothetical protein